MCGWKLNDLPLSKGSKTNEPLPLCSIPRIIFYQSLRKMPQCVCIKRRLIFVLERYLSWICLHQREIHLKTISPIEFYLAAEKCLYYLVNWICDWKQWWLYILIKREGDVAERFFFIRCHRKYSQLEYNKAVVHATILHLAIVRIFHWLCWSLCFLWHGKNSYATLSRVVPWNISLVTRFFSRYTHSPDGSCVYRENTSDLWNIA